jgi:SAM-dependent methyltransferase
MSLIGRLKHLDEMLFGVEFEQYDVRLTEAVDDGTCASLLDVGCGERSPIHRYSAKFPLSVGVDSHAPSIEASRAAGIHKEYVQCDLHELAARFAPQSFDCVIALDVVEHFDKDEGRAFLDALERIARKKVVVFTPNGLVAQPATPDNPHQLHRSGWSAAEMRARGYDVVGIGGWRPLRGAYALPRFRPHWLTARIARLTERWFESRPEGAFQILCVRRM